MSDRWRELERMTPAERRRYFEQSTVKRRTVDAVQRGGDEADKRTKREGA